VFAGGDKAVTADSGVTTGKKVGYDVEFERSKLAFERERMRELEIRRQAEEKAERERIGLRELEIRRLAEEKAERDR